MRLYEKKKFFLTNTMSGKREEFKPAQPPKVSYYSCGPTVYGALHIGNARALIYADWMFRWLKHIGYEVNFVRNYTDVDDKIINRANQEKISPTEVSEKYIEYCETDMKLLGLLPPVKTALVTESIADIIKTVEKIIANGHGYVVNGEVFFSVNSFKGYGKLSGKNVDELEAGARVEIDAKKKHPADFSLWKPHKPGEPFWESPWSKGRPGWHIECSAMVMRWLGETIDLHHGGQDLIFPHHENEIAQSEAATGKPFCAHWTHHAFLTAGNEKMSKSLGNILTTREFIEKYGPELLKFIYLSFHHRSSVPYTQETMSQSLHELERFYRAKSWALDAAEASVQAAANGESFKALVGGSAKLFERIEDEMFMDLNTPGAMGQLFSFIRDINRAETQAAGKPGLIAPSSTERQTVAREFLELIEKKLFPLWNVFHGDPKAALERIEATRRTMLGVQMPSDDELRQLLVDRAAARQAKDFKRADEIRAKFDQYALVIVDTPQGSSWKAKS